MFPLGRLNTKSSVTYASQSPDVDGGPPEHETVLESYYVSVRANSSNAEPQMGGEPPITSYTIVGHYTDKVLPGCKLHTSRGTFDVLSVIDAEGDMSTITMTAKRVENA